MASHRTSSMTGEGIYEMPVETGPYGSKTNSVVGAPGPYRSKPPSVVGSPGPYSFKPPSVVGSPGPYSSKPPSVVGSPGLYSSKPPSVVGSPGPYDSKPNSVGIPADPFSSSVVGSTGPRMDYGGASMLGSGFPRLGYDASIMESTVPKKQAKEYPPQTIKVIAIIFIAIGVLCIAFNITTIVLDSYFAKLAAGIWGGIVYVVAGGVGYWSASERTRKWIVAFMVLCFVVICVSVVLLVQCSIGIDRDRNEHRTLSYRGTDLDEPYLATNCVKEKTFDCQYGWGYDVEWQKWGYDRQIRRLEASIILNCIMVFFSLVMLALAIWAATLCWKGKEGEMTVDEGVFYNASAGSVLSGEKPPISGYLNQGAQFGPNNGHRSFDSLQSDYSQLSLNAKVERSLSSSCAPPPPDYGLVYDPGPRNNNWAGAADLGRAQLAHSFV